MYLFDPAMAQMLMEETESGLFTADQVGGYLCTAVFAILNVAVAYFIIKKLIFKPIMNIMKKREDAIGDSLKSAEELNEQAKKHEEESRNNIEEARAKAAEILDQSRENAEKQAGVIIGTANDEASEIVEHARTDAKRIKKVALEEMKDEVSDLAVKVASRVLGDVVAEEKLKELATKHASEVLDEEVKKLG
ncbi:MAG: F0F1 ATP synthase subunit B [Clostridiales bacterium]|nr:F0F1 ATP synthase subunit B [Clostridiales bacterium]